MMPQRPLQDVNILAFRPLITPERLLAELPASLAVIDHVYQAREAAKGILKGEDPRLLVVVGPCSIHDEVGAYEYAARLAALARDVRSTLQVVMRVYFEKPRTTVGWKGLINDPNLDDTFDIEQGLRRSRQILLRIAEMGLPAATEMLEPIVPQYIADLIVEASIGARTTESPTHRQMASGLSMPVGFKNGTDGSLATAIQALLAARESHSFLGIDSQGKTAIVTTAGNPWGHVILRGGRAGPNYSPQDLGQAVEDLARAHLPPRLMVDCSHGNCAKDYRKQAQAFRSVIAQRTGGNASIIGLMLESYLQPGNQPLGDDLTKLQYGVSITDPCIGWDETETLLREAHEALRRS